MREEETFVPELDLEKMATAGTHGGDINDGFVERILDFAVATPREFPVRSTASWLNRTSAVSLQENPLDFALPTDVNLGR